MNKFYAALKEQFLRHKFIFILALITFVGLYLCYALNFLDVLQDSVSKFLNKQDKYLFFTGAFFISILLIKQKKWLVAQISIGLAIFSLIYWKAIKNWIQNIGVDSLSESQNFSWNEAAFYFHTVIINLEPNLSPVSWIKFTVLALIIYALVRLITKKLSGSTENFSRVIFFVAIFFMGVSVYSAAGSSYRVFLENSIIYQNTNDNFKNNPPVINFSNKGLKLIVYIGESTSNMNMGIYNYPRNTTPRLDSLYKQDNKLLAFKNIFSTHTHTAPSLLEAFSVGVNQEEDFLPINDRKRISLTDILISNKIKTFLLSNQGKSGTWNLASSIIFKHSKNLFSTDSAIFGNVEYNLTRPYDHVFFHANLMPAIKEVPPNESAVVFLHSYAGHGPYISNIPEGFRKPIDDYFSTKNPIAIVGPNINLISEIEGYDSAIKYIDFSIHETIEEIKNNSEPMVLIYFSDHGDSPYSGRGHDSSRFIYEMAKIPFIMYFNDSAKRKFPQLVEKYSNLSKQDEISTLAQLPATIVDLLGGEIENASPTLKKVIGDHDNKAIPPIVVRETLQGLTFVNLNETTQQPTIAKNRFIDATDDQTNIFVTSKNNKNKNTKICYHGADTIGKAIRGALLSDCLEFDLVVEEDSLSVYHPPAESVKLDPSEITKIAKKNNLALWIDSKNLTSGKNCSKLAMFLDAQKPFNNTILIEFPSNTTTNDQELSSCSLSLRANGFHTSYYVPTDKAISCSKHIEAGQQASASKECRSLEEDLLAAYQSTLFTDYSFDYNGINAMEKIAVADKLKWNTWGVDPKSFNQIKPARFRMVILNNIDPNNR